MATGGDLGSKADRGGYGSLLLQSWSNRSVMGSLTTCSVPSGNATGVTTRDPEQAGRACTWSASRLHSIRSPPQSLQRGPTMSCSKSSIARDACALRLGYDSQVIGQRIPGSYRHNRDNRFCRHRVDNARTPICGSPVSGAIESAILVSTRGYHEPSSCERPWALTSCCLNPCRPRICGPHKCNASSMGPLLDQNRWTADWVGLGLGQFCVAPTR
jgi:hypothetical protein